MRKDGQFNYTPKYSERLKMRRIELLRKKGLYFNNISVGDPEDKPHLDFFEKGVNVAEKNLGHKINLKNAIMIDDSFNADLKVPKEELGFGLVVLFQKGKKNTEINDYCQITTGNLFQIARYLTK